MDSLVSEQLLKALKDEHAAEQVLTAQRQARVATELGQDRLTMEGVGQPKLEVDSYSYHYWGQRLGYKCWKDKKFVAEFWRDNPSARVQTARANPFVGWTPSVDRNVRFTKKYA
jgi:hypothetical protein